MNLLLDTHIWIWNSLEPWKLTSEVNLALADPQNELFLSPVSIWELVMLLEKKRVFLDVEMDRWIEKSKTELMLREAGFSWVVADELRYTLLSHRDLADRFLVATAKAYGLTLVTSDERLARAPGLNVLVNRQ
jgi:PIN domain nuclease of toxin-antitoxin system